MVGDKLFEFEGSIQMCKKKRLLALFLTLAMSMSMVACTNSNNANGDVGGAETPSSTVETVEETNTDNDAAQTVNLGDSGFTANIVTPITPEALGSGTVK